MGNECKACRKRNPEEELHRRKHTALNEQISLESPWIIDSESEAFD